MSITDKNYFQRRALSSKVLTEEVTKVREEKEAKEKKLLESAYDNTFKLQSKKSTRMLREKNTALQKALNEATDCFVTDVVRKAVPFELNNVSNEELLEQIKAVRDQYSELLHENAVLTPAVAPAGLDLARSDHVSLFIGIGSQTKQAQQTADRLARNVLTLQGLSYIKDKTPISFCYNNLDSQIAYGDASEAMTNSPLSSTLVQLTGVFSSQVRSRLGNALREDADKQQFSESVLLEGKTGVALDIAKRKLARQSKPSLLEEVFKTTKILNESTGANPEDYMNESVFVTAILETYNILGCIKMDMNQVSETLYKKRKAFSK